MLRAATLLGGIYLSLYIVRNRGDSLRQVIPLVNYEAFRLILQGVLMVYFFSRVWYIFIWFIDGQRILNISKYCYIFILRVDRLLIVNFKEGKAS